MKKRLSSAVIPRRVCASFKRIKTWLSVSSTFWLCKAWGGQGYLWAGPRAEITVPTVSPLPQGNNGPPRQRGPRGIFIHRWSPGIKRNWFKSLTAAARKALLHFNRLHSTKAALIWWQESTNCEIQKPHRSVKKLFKRYANAETASHKDKKRCWIPQVVRSDVEKLINSVQPTQRHQRTTLTRVTGYWYTAAIKACA